MCASCCSSTQGAYNAGDENTDSKPYGTHSAVTQSQSVDEQGLTSQVAKWDLSKSTYHGNPSNGNGAYQ